MAKHASRMDTIRIHDRLKELLQPMGDGFWIYPEGMEDGTVAKELNVKKASVAGTRVECFGLLFRRAAPQKAGQLAEVQLALRNLQVCYEELKIKHNKLCDTLSLERIVNVRHLTVNPVHAGTA